MAGPRLILTAITFNTLDQYTSSLGHRAYSYAAVAVFFFGSGGNHCHYSAPTHGGWPG